MFFLFVFEFYPQIQMIFSKRKKKICYHFKCPLNIFFFHFRCFIVRSKKTKFFGMICYIHIAHIYMRDSLPTTTPCHTPHSKKKNPSFTSLFWPRWKRRAALHQSRAGAHAHTDTDTHRHTHTLVVEMMQN